MRYRINIFLVRGLDIVEKFTGNVADFPERAQLWTVEPFFNVVSLYHCLADRTLRLPAIRHCSIPWHELNREVPTTLSLFAVEIR